jgi:hypothetical protein
MEGRPSLTNMTWLETESRLKARDDVLVPIHSILQHTD